MTNDQPKLIPSFIVGVVATNLVRLLDDMKEEELDQVYIANRLWDMVGLLTESHGSLLSNLTAGTE